MKKTWIVVPLALILIASCAPSLGSSPENVTVEFWHTFGDEKRSGWIQATADEYNTAHPGVTIVPSFKGDSNTTLQSTILGARQGQVPALVQVEGVASQLALDSGVFQPVSAIQEVDFSDYLEPVISYYTVEGKVNSVPWNSSSPVLYFNKNLMEQAGLDPNNPPQTFGAIQEACATFAAAEPDIKCVALTPYAWLFEQWMSQQNVALVNNGNGRSARATETAIDSPAGREVFKFYKDLNDKGFLTNTGKLADTVGTNAIFTEQKALMTINSTAGLGNILDGAKQSGFELGVGVLPIPDGSGRNGVQIGGASLWVTKDVNEATAKAALDFSLFMTNTDHMADWHKVTGYYPVRTSSVELLRSEGWFDTSPLQVVAFNQLLETVPNEVNAGALNGATIETRNAIEQGMQKVLSGQSVESVATAAAQQANAAIAEYNKNFN